VKAAEALLEDMKRRGVALSVQSDSLNYDGELDERDVKRLAMHKKALVALLSPTPVPRKRATHDSVTGQLSVKHPAVKEARPRATLIGVVPTTTPRPATGSLTAPRRPLPSRESGTGRFVPRVSPSSPAHAETSTEAAPKPSRSVLARILYGDEDERSVASPLEAANPALSWLDRLIYGGE
jgi:hypothetical protein